MSPNESAIPIEECLPMSHTGVPLPQATIKRTGCWTTFEKFRQFLINIDKVKIIWTSLDQFGK